MPPDNDTQRFMESPGWQAIIEPAENRVLSINASLQRVVPSPQAAEPARLATDLFSSSLRQLVVFTDELITRGFARTDELILRTTDGDCQVETFGCNHQHQRDVPVLHLVMQSLSDIDNYRKQRDATHYFKSGFNHWDRVSRVFQEFERDHQMLLNAAGEGIYGIDHTGATTFVNPAAQAILGYSNTELFGKNMHAVVHHSRADGTQFHDRDCPILSTCREGLVNTVKDDVFWTKSGTPVEVEYTSTPINEDGSVVGAVVVFRDVSEKRSDERRLRAALDEVEQLKNRLEMEKAYLQEEISSKFNNHQIIGKSPALLRSIQQVELVGPTDATVLITGESGTGKELVARAIHQTSKRSARPLIRVNCAAIPSDLFESEFFGHVKGSFTGATRDRAGRFELADGGTLFLDEVGEIPLHLQSKLLRVLQERQFERIGDNSTREVNVRLVAATNQDLQELVDAGKFREDLYFRLNVFPIETIPLRARNEDIPILTQHFLERACLRTNRPLTQVSKRGMKALQSYHWPGNIRELENVIEREVILGDNARVLSFDNLNPSRAVLSDALEPDEALTILTDDQLRSLERRNILNALRRSGGKVSGQDGAAALLCTRPSTLSSRIKKLKINIREMKSQA